MLLFALVLVLVVLFGTFWGGTLLAQGYLYQQPAEQLPIRAAIAALLVGSFLAIWVGIDRRNPGKYDTFFEFAGETTEEFGEFEAVRWTAAGGKLIRDGQGNPVETKVKFKKSGKAAEFAREGSAPPEPFRLNDGTMLTAAMVVDLGGPVRFNAEFDKKTAVTNPTYTREKKFVEDRGSRYIFGEKAGVLHVPSTGVIAASLALNLLLFVAWFLAFWVALRFNRGHALGFALIFGLVSMLVLMPMLFEPNRQKLPEGAALASPGRSSAV